MEFLLIVVTFKKSLLWYHRTRPIGLSRAKHFSVTFSSGLKTTLVTVLSMIGLTKATLFYYIKKKIHFKNKKTLT